MSVSKEAKLISTTFSELREMGFLVFNFNAKSLKRVAGGMKGFCDLVIIGKKTGIHYIEVKLTSTNDKFKPNQKELGETVSHISDLTEYINYWVIHNLDEAYAVFDFILHGTEIIGDIKNGTTK